MSIYNVNKICYLSQHDPALRERLRTDPASALAGFRLTDEERRALLEGDVVRLYTLGAHPYLLGHLPRYQLLGLNRQNYQRRMKTLLPSEAASTESAT